MRHAANCTGVVLAALIAVAGLAPRASAQASTDFGLCLIGPFPACTDVFLTTTPAGTGTLVDVAVRQRSLGAAPSALVSLAFRFPTSATADLVAGTPTLEARGGAPSVVGPVEWTASGYAESLVLVDAVPFGATPPATQYVVGCGGGSFAGSPFAVSLVTCGTGAYAFRYLTAAAFDARAVTGFSLDIVVGSADPALPAVVSCDVDRGGNGTCLDFANLVDPTVPFAASASSSVPEPGPLALVAMGAVGAFGIDAARRRRRVPSSSPHPVS